MNADWSTLTGASSDAGPAPACWCRRRARPAASGRSAWWPGGSAPSWSSRCPGARVRAASRSPARASIGSSRSGSTVPAASATAGATASTGSTPRPPESRPSTENWRSCQAARPASTSSARSMPADAASRTAVRRPRRTATVPGETDRSEGQTRIAVQSSSTAPTVHQSSAGMPVTFSPAAFSEPTLASTAAEPAAEHRARGGRDRGHDQRLDQRHRDELPATGPPGAEDRRLFLALAGQRPRGERQRGPGQQQQLKLADQQQRPGHHQLGRHHVEHARQAAGHLQPAEADDAAELTERLGDPGGQRLQRLAATSGGAQAVQPGGAADRDLAAGQAARPTMNGP